MMWFKQTLRRWVFEAEACDVNKPASAHHAIADSPAVGLMEGGDAQIRVSLRSARNGKILEVGTFKPNPRGPDWTYQYYIVPEGEDISQWVTTALVSQRLSP